MPTTAMSSHRAAELLPLMIGPLHALDCITCAVICCARAQAKSSERRAACRFSALPVASVTLPPRAAFGTKGYSLCRSVEPHRRGFFSASDAVPDVPDVRGTPILRMGSSSRAAVDGQLPNRRWKTVGTAVGKAVGSSW
jgi:hypothetical protein